MPTATGDNRELMTGIAFMRGAAGKREELKAALEALIEPAKSAGRAAIMPPPRTRSAQALDPVVDYARSPVAEATAVGAGAELAGATSMEPIEDPSQPYFPGQ